MITMVYVDNKMALSNDRRAIETLKTQLTCQYEMTDLSEARWILYPQL